MRRAALVLMLSAGAFSQTSPVPYDDGTGPRFSHSETSQLYPQYYLSIGAVDFRNLCGDAAGKPGRICFNNGRYKSDEPGSNYSEELDSIRYLRGSSSPQGGSALVLYSWTDGGGSSSQGSSATVFTVTQGSLRSVQTIGWDTHFQAGEPTDSFDPRTNTLVIRSAHYIPGDAHCCVSAMDVVTLRWDGNVFVPTGIQTELSEYGRSAGKTLPR